jgi:hypothetical protein
MIVRFTDVTMTANTNTNTQATGGFKVNGDVNVRF